MSFANCQMGGVSIATPDVCKTPRGTSTPPIPYPNKAQGATANPGTAVQNVLISGAAAHTLQTVVPMSSGDEQGVCGGVVSGMMMGPSRHLMGASNVLIGGMPATKMGDPTGQNGTSLNAKGTTTAPAQTKVMINSGGSGVGASQQSSTNASQAAGQPAKLTVTHPRWEHLSDNVKQKRPKRVHKRDTVYLKVDVQNAPAGAKVRFNIFSEDVKTKNLRYVTSVYDTTLANGVGTGKWQVQDPRRDGLDEGKPLSLKFEAQVLGERSGKVNLPVADVAPTLILRDGVGADAAPLCHTKWTLRRPKTLLASGTTDENGVVKLPEGLQLRPEKEYELRFAGRTVRLLALFQERLGGAVTPEGTQTRLLMLGYNCGNENGTFGPSTKAALTGYRDEKALGVGECDSASGDALNTDIGVKKQ